MIFQTEFQNHSTEVKSHNKIEVFKMGYCKNTNKNIRHEKQAIKNKTDKNWKRI